MDEHIGCPNPVDGEALAVYHGLLKASTKGWMSIIMESDNLQVINILSHGASSLASYGAILDSYFMLLASFSSLSFNFVKCSGNLLAHELATNPRFSCKHGFDLPSEIISII